MASTLASAEPDHDAGEVAQHARDAGSDGSARMLARDASGSNDEAVSGASPPRDDAPRQVRRRSDAIGYRVAYTGSVVVIAAGSYWFVERVFFPV